MKKSLVNVIADWVICFADDINHWDFISVYGTAKDPTGMTKARRETRKELRSGGKGIIDWLQTLINDDIAEAEEAEQLKTWIEEVCK